MTEIQNYREKSKMETTLTSTEKVVNMLKDIDGNFERTAQKASLNYDRSTLAKIIRKGYVAVIGDKVTRKYHALNYGNYN